MVSLNKIFSLPPNERVHALIRHWSRMDTPCYLPGMKYVEASGPHFRREAILTLRTILENLSEREKHFPHLHPPNIEFCRYQIQQGIYKLSSKS